MLPQIFLHAADARPRDIHDILPADTRFKLLFFVGLLTEERVAELNVLCDKLRAPSCFLQKYGHLAEGTTENMFSIITIMSGKKEDVEFSRVPTLLRPHWSRYVLKIYSVSRLPIHFIAFYWMTPTFRDV